MAQDEAIWCRGEVCNYVKTAIWCRGEVCNYVKTGNGVEARIV